MALTTDHHRGGPGIRLMRAADADRRRLARDLHDGLQLRLVLLAMRADQLCLDERACPAARAHGDGIRAELQAAIEELRAFVDGVMPAALCERGLVAAIRELVGSLPIAVRLTLRGVDDRHEARPARLPEAVESVAYFVVCEALGNAVKHAGADRVAIALTLADGRLQVTVSDDGVGGADERGSGIRGVADRVEALEGRLTVYSPGGCGTRVVAQLPCRPATADEPAAARAPVLSAAGNARPPAPGGDHRASGGARATRRCGPRA
jgi:signal transduction histidine kinase